MTSAPLSQDRPLLCWSLRKMLPIASCEIQNAECSVWTALRNDGKRTNADLAQAGSGKRRACLWAHFPDGAATKRIVHTAVQTAYPMLSGGRCFLELQTGFTRRIWRHHRCQMKRLCIVP